MRTASEKIELKLTPRQLEAFRWVGKGKIIFYGGARGGGKSHLARVAALWAAMSHDKLRVVMIRRTVPELNEVFITRFLEDYPPDRFGYVWRPKDNTFIFRNYSRIIFRPISDDKDLEKVLGLEYQFIVIDEANVFPESYIHRIRGSLRGKREDFLPTMLMTGNPGGLSDHYFRTRFVNPDYRYWRANELADKERYVFIPARVWDNPFVGQEYVRELEGLPEEWKRRWLDGDWSIAVGRFFTEWNPDVHVVSSFDVPESWSVVCGIDIGGGRHPSAAVWVAQSPETSELFVVGECTSLGTVEDFIDILCSTEEKLGIRADSYWADPSIWTREMTLRISMSPAMLFWNRGIAVMRANNDRVNGWRIVKSWMHIDSSHGKPMLFVFDRCSELIRTIPLAVYASSGGSAREDLNTDGEDDLLDALRYAVASAFPIVGRGTGERRHSESEGEEETETLLPVDDIVVSPRVNYL